MLHNRKWYFCFVNHVTEWLKGSLADGWGILKCLFMSQDDIRFRYQQWLHLKLQFQKHENYIKGFPFDMSWFSKIFDHCFGWNQQHAWDEKSWDVCINCHSLTVSRGQLVSLRSRWDKQLALDKNLKRNCKRHTGRAHTHTHTDTHAYIHNAWVIYCFTSVYHGPCEYSFLIGQQVCV